MGYDLHITRAKDWVDSAIAPIGEAEWTTLIDADATLALDVRSGERHAIWSGHPRGVSMRLWLNDGEIVVKEPDEPMVLKAIAIAAQLDASVLGDDGERYTIDAQRRLLIDGELPPPPPSVAAPTLPWTLLVISGAVIAAFVAWWLARVA